MPKTIYNRQTAQTLNTTQTAANPHPATAKKDTRKSKINKETQRIIKSSQSPPQKKERTQLLQNSEDENLSGSRRTRVDRRSPSRDEGSAAIASSAALCGSAS